MPPISRIIANATRALPALAAASTPRPRPTPAASDAPARLISSAGRPAPTARRVAAPGDEAEAFGAVTSLEAVPRHYRRDNRFASLSDDPAQGTGTPTALREAMSGLEAERVGICTPLIYRGPAQIEFFDGEGRPFDVKTPRSPADGERWTYRPKSAAKSIAKKLRRTCENAKTGKDEPVRIILDTTYLTPQDHSALWDELNAMLTPAEAQLVFELNVRL